MHGWWQCALDLHVLDDPFINYVIYYKSLYDYLDNKVDSLRTSYANCVCQDDANVYAKVPSAVSQEDSLIVLCHLKLSGFDELFRHKMNASQHMTCTNIQLRVLRYICEANLV